MSQTEPAAVLHFYQGADGPSLMFQLYEEAHLKALRRVFERLAAGEIECTSFKESGILNALDGLDDLLVVLRSKDGELSRSVKRISSSRMGLVFQFTRPKEGWLECVELLDGLKGPGHQYLSRESSDEAHVIVSYRENLSATRP